MNIEHILILNYEIIINYELIIRGHYNSTNEKKKLRIILTNTKSVYCSKSI